MSTGLRYLNLKDYGTKKLVDDGYYVDFYGNIGDTTIYPGDTVKLNVGSRITTVNMDDTYTVQNIKLSGRSSIGLPYYRTGHSSPYYVYFAHLQINGKLYLAKNFTKTGVNTMTTTIVREFAEHVSVSNVERVYIGEQKEFNTLAEANKFVSAAISNSLRTDNKYRKFVLFQEVCVAQAKQPEVEFVC